MTRGTSRMVVKTRSGFSEIRVERRVLPRAETGIPVSLPVLDRLPIIPAALSLADQIAKRLRNRSAFPRDFYEGAVE